MIQRLLLRGRGRSVIIIINSAGTSLVSNSFHLAGIQNIFNFGINTFWFLVKVEGMTDDRGTSADYYY